MMKQSVLIAPRRSKIEDVELPQLSADGVLVRVRASGICASELHSWDDGHGAPYPLGHEVAGQVVAVGPEVKTFQPGDRVTGLFHKGFSDYAATSVDRVLPIPANLRYEDAFGEPLACAMSAARRTKVELGDRVAIVGQGFMGLLILQLIRLKGPAEIVGIDLREDARRMSLKLGADRAVSREEADSLGDFDVVIEATGQPDGLSLAIKLVRLHGVMAILGYHQGGPRSVDMQLWNYKSIEVLNAHERRNDYRMDSMRRALDLAAAGRIDLSALASHSFSIDQIDDAFGALASKPAGFVKSVMVAGDDPGFSLPKSAF
jgi:2-desacetyl-2-hydroxyethyl bacteriochlorophyllide A dehydrogenase